MPATAVALIALLALPPVGHSTRVLDGWTVHVDTRLAADARAVKLLEAQLVRVSAVTAPARLARLRRVEIWLDVAHGGLVRPQYHPSAGWLADHGYSRALAKAVHIPHAATFAGRGFQFDQPSAVLHELAHAYHDQELGFADARVAAAHAAYVAGGRGKSVLHVRGRVGPHYATTNPMEFFAEMTECYLGRNDFYPFNAGELRQAEPAVFRLLADIWGPLE